MPSAGFIYTGAYQYWTVPDGVTSISVALAGGGSGSTAAGRVTGTLAVTPGHKLAIVVGQAGQLASGASGGGHAWGGGGLGGDANNGSGGDGGGGYSAIRLDSSSGTIKAVAGGAGGTSGDNGAGGLGGGTTGGAGSRGTSGSNSTSPATGGTQSQGGNGGTSSSGSEFDGHDASDTNTGAYGGAGGGPSPYHSHGGGGGGGGFHQGGGGQASSFGFAPGGGGGGGSSYTGGLTGAANLQGAGGTGGGAVTLTWVTPPPADLPPTTPSSAQINGTAETPAFPTKSTGSVTLSAVLNDSDPGDTIRLLARYSLTSAFTTYTDKYSGYVSTAQRASVTLTGLALNTHYYVRLYGQDNHGTYSTTYNSLDFWTDRPPNPPALTAPPENATVPGTGSTVFTWTYSDPDPSDPVTGWELRYRTAATITQSAGAWVTLSEPTNVTSTWTLNPFTFRGSTFYEWQVRTKDTEQQWGDWSDLRSFFVSSLSSPPVPLAPLADAALDANVAQTFTWRFVDPDPGDAQTKADIRYRLVGQGDSDWVMLLGSLTTPGAVNAWAFPAQTFIPNYHYEWEVRTYDTFGGTQSDWSQVSRFWATGTPGAALVGSPSQISPLIEGSLGCGEYEVYVYWQGGTKVFGQVDPMSSLSFTRLRDGISTASIISNGPGWDCAKMYGNMHCWLHEIVIFRDGRRVWEGPITGLTFQGDTVRIDAQDVMVYAFRRILRQGYNDSFQVQNGQAVPSPSVVQRAQQILVNALAPYDPNILPFLTAIQFDDDAKESRVVADYSRTAWEEVDDMAATAGLDYTTIGRRIVLWDTHRPIGRLQELRDGDFSADPIISEYGMQLCNYQAVTNGSGVWGAATPHGLDVATEPVVGSGWIVTSPGGPILRDSHGNIVGPYGEPDLTNTQWWKVYGPVELLASAYGESASGADDVLTAAAKQALIDTMNDQAARNIADRWPTPVLVRVPDNSSLSPEAPVTFDQLVPGVWVPLRSTQYMRTVQQWQKLDSVTVNVDGSGREDVQVVLSPAPNAGQDPDQLAAIAAASN